MAAEWITLPHDERAANIRKLLMQDDKMQALQKEIAWWTPPVEYKRDTPTSASGWCRLQDDLDAYADESNYVEVAKRIFEAREAIRSKRARFADAGAKRATI